MSRPAVRINQLGYVSNGPKHAVWVSERREPAAFHVVDGAGGAAEVEVGEGDQPAAGHARRVPIHAADEAGGALGVADQIAGDGAEISGLQTIADEAQAGGVDGQVARSAVGVVDDAEVRDPLLAAGA